MKSPSESSAIVTIYLGRQILMSDHELIQTAAFAF